MQGHSVLAIDSYALCMPKEHTDGPFKSRWSIKRIYFRMNVDLGKGEWKNYDQFFHGGAEISTWLKEGL